MTRGTSLAKTIQFDNEESKNQGPEFPWFILKAPRPKIDNGEFEYRVFEVKRCVLRNLIIFTRKNHLSLNEISLKLLKLIFEFSIVNIAIPKRKLRNTEF